MNRKNIILTLLVILGLVVVSGCTTNKLTERPLMVDDNGEKIVSVNVSENYGSGGVHALKEENGDNYEFIKALNLTNNSELEAFKDVIALTKGTSQLSHDGIAYYQVNSIQKLENRKFNIFGGLKVKDINTYIAYTMNNNSKTAVVVIGTGGSHVAETIANVNFY